MAKKTVHVMNEAEVDIKMTPEHVEEVVLASLTDDDLRKASKEALDIRSWAGFRLALVLLVQRCNQAGYGVDGPSSTALMPTTHGTITSGLGPSAGLTG